MYVYMHVVRILYSVSVCGESFISFKIFISSIIEQTFFDFMFNFTMEFINEYNDVVQKIQTVFSTSLHGCMLFEDGSRINLLVLSALSIQIRYSLHIRIKEKFDIFFWSRENPYLVVSQTASLFIWSTLGVLLILAIN